MAEYVYSLRYVNEAGKGGYNYVGERKAPYRFTDLAFLNADFGPIQEIARRVDRDAKASHRHMQALLIAGAWSFPMMRCTSTLPCERWPDEQEIYQTAFTDHSQVHFVQKQSRKQQCLAKLPVLKSRIGFSGRKGVRYGRCA
ncbi:hypothetical protein AA11237_0589 [Acidocella aminolytica 101 = DSM 11237]|nr:hypothetical protein AA11237_0589 [Acidocella aminolytica 101 = DSM 11237]